VLPGKCRSLIASARATTHPCTHTLSRLRPPGRQDVAVKSLHLIRCCPRTPIDDVWVCVCVCVRVRTCGGDIDCLRMTHAVCRTTSGVARWCSGCTQSDEQTQRGEQERSSGASEWPAAVTGSGVAVARHEICLYEISSYVQFVVARYCNRLLQHVNENHDYECNSSKQCSR
jgi:hypothetical protein